MKTQHTKGPWLFDGHENVPRDNGTYALGANISNLDGKNIATVMISGPWIDDVSEAEGNANYHLIAAAPEMLEALEQALRCLVVAEHNGAFADCAAPRVGEKLIQKIDSILDKAKGEL